MADLGDFTTYRALGDAAENAVRRDINERALAGEWITAHEANISAFGYSSYQSSFFGKKRLKPFAREAARAALAKASPEMLSPHDQGAV